MKAIICALLTTQLAQGARFVIDFNEYNKSEFDQTQGSLAESEKQLGAHMNTPAFTEHAKRIEAQN